ncbi:Solute carrier organic anion transporter family member [Caligus rogercresseyi]|uniref:Solute carrier organic anion transporter family member n=1 Tax=Caligus rogercresseyi TaxID=217165 RepID=A0A7T8GTK7_CALRO|nr:Solute carrier organic anion transporter family member [Caligus rogercresseyi]
MASEIRYTPEYMLVYCIIGIIHGMLFSYFSTILSTIEKIWSQIAGNSLVYSGNEISQVFFLLALPFMGLVRKRTLFMGYPSCSQDLGYFSVEPSYDAEALKEPLCTSNSTVHSSCSSFEEEAASHLRTKWIGISFIFIGIFLHGIGASFYNTLGIPYIDDNSEKSNSPMALSFVITAKMADERVSQQVTGEPGFDETDDRWIGAWWLGFYIFGPILIVVAPLLILFPERLPTKDSEEGEDKTPDFVIETPQSTAEWFQLTKTLFIAFLFGFIGFITFLPKFIKFNFRKSSSASGIAGGLSTSFPLPSEYSPRGGSLALWCVISDCIGIFFFVGIVFIGCNSITTSSCHCSQSDYQPVCSIDGTLQFASPCFAGCTSVDKGGSPDGKKSYGNCSCVSGGKESFPLLTNNSSSFSGEVVSKYCEDPSCASHFVMFMALLGIFGIIGSSTRIPNLILSLRAIDPRDKASALTLTISLLSLFAFLPATVVFGAIIDMTCEVWETKECSQVESNCLVYNNGRMRLYAGLFMAFFICVQVVFDCLVWYHTKDLVLYDESEESKETDTKTEISS